MKLFPSVTQIPELKNLPRELASRVWFDCSRKHAEGFGIVFLLMFLGMQIGEWVVGDDWRSVGGFAGGMLGAILGNRLSIPLLRPHIRRFLENPYPPALRERLLHRPIRRQSENQSTEKN